MTKLEEYTWFRVLQHPLNIWDITSCSLIRKFTTWLFPAVGQQSDMYELFLPKTEVWHFPRFSPCLVTFPKSENCPFLLHSLCLIIRKRQYTRPWPHLSVFFLFANECSAFVGGLCWHKSLQASFLFWYPTNKIPQHLEVVLQCNQKLFIYNLIHL